MFKMIGLLKKRPGMSSEEFRDYYERYHRVIGEKYLSGRAVKYMRRYLTGFADVITGEQPAMPYDVVLEIWYPDKQTFDQTNELLAAPDIAREIEEDEKQLFDRSKNAFFYVDEVESVLTNEARSC